MRFVEKSIGKPVDVFAISAQNVDEIYKVDKIAPDYETAIKEPIMSPGGSAANTAYALAKLGLSVTVAGIVGKDAHGTMLRQGLLEAGIDVSCLLDHTEKAKRTGKTIVITDDMGRRSIFVDQGVNDDFVQFVQQNDITFNGQIDSCRLMHLSSFVASDAKRFSERQCASLRQDAILSFTPGSIYSRHGLESNKLLLSRANVVFMYQEQFQDLMVSGEISDPQNFKKIMDDFFNWRKKNGHSRPIIISIKKSRNTDAALLSHYSVLAYGRDSLEALVFPDDDGSRPHSRRTYGLGAGDALAAGLIYALLNQFSPQAAANLCYAMAEKASNEIGARRGLGDSANLIREATSIGSR